MKNEDREKLVKNLVALMDKGVAPWTAGWKVGSGSSKAVNATTERAYTRGNAVLCWVAMMIHGYRSSRWITWHQATQAGGKIKEGQAKAFLWLYRPFSFNKKDREKQPVMDAEGNPLKSVGFQTFHIYNVDQWSDLPEAFYGERAASVDVPADFAVPEADVMYASFIERSGVTHIEQGDRAFYRRSSDTITVPEKGLFMAKAEERKAAGMDAREAMLGAQAEFYGSLFHEAGHATGVEKRLKRDMSGRYGSPEYAFEELVAEICAAFCLQANALPGYCQHAEYLAEWSKQIAADPQVFFKAAALAGKAADLIIGTSASQEDEPGAKVEPEAEALPLAAAA